jgi:hypothetical protein
MLAHRHDAEKVLHMPARFMHAHTIKVTWQAATA